MPTTCHDLLKKRKKRKKACYAFFLSTIHGITCNWGQVRAK